MASLIPTTSITADHDCQPRIAIDPRIVDDYADDMTEGAGFPPLTVYFDGQTHWLADGFHRLSAAMKLGLAEIECDVRTGGKRDAILYSCSANASHGLRRTNQDKRRSVNTLISDPEWSKWSDNEIAKRCGVTHPFVGSLRPSLVTVTSEKVYTDRYGNQRIMDTSNIGKSTPQPTPQQSPTNTRPARYEPMQMDERVEDEPFPESVEWSLVDLDGFQNLRMAISRDPIKVAYAAYGTQPQDAERFTRDLAKATAWLAEFSAEMRAISQGLA